MRLALILIVCLSAAAASAMPASADPEAKSDTTAWPVIRMIDSTNIQRSGYGSAADLLAQVPGAFVFDRGSVGQLAAAALFSGSFRHLDATWDGLLLNDPVSGVVDWNLVPVEGIERIDAWVGPGDETAGLISAGHSLYVTGRDLAGSGLRSATAYRTGGNGYDDVDVRLGLKPTAHSALTAGAVLKNYGGTAADEKYRAQKVNLSVERRFGPQWRLRYLLLLNKMDRDVPWSTSTPQVPFLHEKLDRYDHGLSLQAHRVSVFWQYTDLHREFYHRPTPAAQQIQNAGRSRLLMQYGRRLGPVQWHSGGLWQHSRMEISGRSDSRRGDLEAWTQLGSTAHAPWFWLAGVQAQRRGDQKTAVLPQVQVARTLAAGWNSRLWYGSHVTCAGLSGGCGVESYVAGDRAFEQERSDQWGGALEKNSDAVRYFISVSYSSDRMTLSSLPSQTAAFTQDANRWAVDIGVEQKLNRCFSFYADLRQTRDNEKDPLPQPAQQAWGCVQYANIFFSGDLDVRLRVGFNGWGERGENSLMPGTRLPSPALSPVVVPFAHLGVKIKSARLFFMLRNFAGIDYQLLPGYMMPKQQLRWGFVWDFFD